MEPPVSSSRGPMGSLLWKLDWLESQHLLRNPVRESFELLKEDLVGIDTFLMELSDEDDPNLMKQYWMKEVREICYDTEDYVDWLFHSQLKIGSVAVAPRLKIGRLPRTLNPRPNIASQIKELRGRLQDAGERHKRYILDNDTTPSSSNFMHSHWIPEWSREAASILVGIDDSKEKLIKLLNNGEKQLNVISISGLGGIGKTTLAKQILQELGWQFGCHAFVRASRKPDTKSLLRSILSQTGWRYHSEAGNLQQLIEHLSEHLRHRRYLIVIDDLWDTAVWDFLLCAFPDGTQSSRIITTTTSENVAMACCGSCSDYILKMEPLSDDDSRKIFFARVFGSENKCPQQFEDASYEIVRKCGGVPLAVIHIAGLLTHQQDKSEEWDYVERSLGSNLSISPTYEGMRKVINLSYNGLPQCLKTCLQYVCMYPENCTIWKDDLVRRWVAEGFIEGDRERDNEAIAQSHFEELVYRGMIQAIGMNYNDQVLSCTVHPIVLDFVTSKSAEDNFITTVDYSKNAREICSKVRRLLLFYSSAKYAAKLSGMTLSQVRSLAFYGLVKCLPSIREYKFLRVLVLHLWGDENDSTRLNLSGIDRLFQLKYLKITCNFCVQLPTQMWGLNHLEALEINAKETSVPDDIVHLKYLAHLSLPLATKLPYGMSRLRSLRTLKHFDLCGSSDEEVKSLKELSVLEELQLVLTTAPADSVETNLNVLFSIIWLLENLKSLALVRGASVPKHSAPIIDSSRVRCATEHLERLELRRGTCILRSLPMWLGGSLCILKLGVLEILMHDVDSLAGLQVLKFLSLYVRRPTVEPIIFRNGAFPALECFKFRSGVLCIAFQPGAMAKLCKLKLSFNAHSRVGYDDMPMLVGIEHLQNLQEVSGRIGAAVGAKESDNRTAESALKDAISKLSKVPRFSVRIVDWIFEEFDNVERYFMLLRMRIAELFQDDGFPGKKSDDSINKKPSSGWTSKFSYAAVTSPDVLNSDDERRSPTYIVTAPKMDNTLDFPKSIGATIGETIIGIMCASDDKLGYEKIIKNKDLEELRELGSGSFGIIYHGKWRGTDVAIRRMNSHLFAGTTSEERMRIDLCNEAGKLASLHHPNLIAFYGVVLDGPSESIATVTEYMAHGSLRRALKRHEKILDWRRCLLIAMDIAFGMEYLHARNIVHFNLTSDNLFMNLRDPQRPICKVDVDLLMVKRSMLTSDSLRGTLPWMAPELISGDSSNLVSEKVDVFSFGIVMWELLTGEEPYANMHYGAIIGGILNNTLRPPLPESCDPQWRSLMEQCWSSKLSERPSFTEICNSLRVMLATAKAKNRNRRTAARLARTLLQPHMSRLRLGRCHDVLTLYTLIIFLYVYV